MNHELSLRNVVGRLLPCCVLAGCASNPRAELDKIHEGMDKGDVLEIAGNPRRTFRESSRDYWLYQYYDRDKQANREIVFQEGHVVKILSPAEQDSWLKDLESSETMEEYQQKALEHQKNLGNGQ